MKKPLKNRPAVVTNIDDLFDRFLSIANIAATDTRKIIAIAGPPGSGKSTLMSAVLARLQNSLIGDQIIGIPMDGFHLDNCQLDIDNLRSVKGAPHTFDVQGLYSLITRLHSGEYPVYAPEFDRASDLSRNCAIKIGQAHKTVLIEGNYLLLDKPVWQEFARHFALSVSIDVPNDILQRRLVQRWLDHGHSEEEARRKAMGNDVPNAKLVVEQSIAADIIYKPRNHT